MLVRETMAEYAGQESSANSDAFTRLVRLAYRCANSCVDRVLTWELGINGQIVDLQRRSGTTFQEQDATLQLFWPRMRRIASGMAGARAPD